MELFLKTLLYYYNRQRYRIFRSLHEWFQEDTILWRRPVSNTPDAIVCLHSSSWKSVPPTSFLMTLWMSWITASCDWSKTNVKSVMSQLCQEILTLQSSNLTLSPFYWTETSCSLNKKYNLKFVFYTTAVNPYLYSKPPTVWTYLSIM